jgi:hypothetical protein
MVPRRLCPARWQRRLTGRPGRRTLASKLHVPAPRAQSGRSRSFVHADRTSCTPPPRPAQPGAGRPHRRDPDRPRHRLSKPVEPRRRRVRVDPAAFRWSMLARIEQHIDQPTARLAGRGQRVKVISIRPHRPPPPRHTIHRPGHPDGQPLGPRRQRPAVVRLDDQMQVVALHREVKQPKPRPARRRQRPPHRHRHPRPPHRRHPRPRPHRHVHRRPWVMRAPPPMSHPRPPPRSQLPPRPHALPSPGPGELESELPCHEQ